MINWSTPSKCHNSNNSNRLCNTYDHRNTHLQNRASSNSNMSNSSSNHKSFLSKCPINNSNQCLFHLNSTRCLNSMWFRNSKLKQFYNNSNSNSSSCNFNSNNNNSSKNCCSSNNNNRTPLLRARLSHMDTSLFKHSSNSHKFQLQQSDTHLQGKPSNYFLNN